MSLCRLMHYNYYTHVCRWPLFILRIPYTTNISSRKFFCGFQGSQIILEIFILKASPSLPSHSQAQLAASANLTKNWLILQYFLTLIIFAII